LAVIVKNAGELEKMRAAGRIVYKALEMLEKMITPGAATGELDRAADGFIRENGGTPSFLGYRDFPKSICVSVNEEVIHGIPGIKRLKDGDIVSIDIGVTLDGWQSDAARTFSCGRISRSAERLIEVTRQCFFEGIRQARNGNHLFQVSRAIQEHAERNGCSVVRDFVGHGIGRSMHEDPSIPNFKPPGRGVKLQKGMTLAIEPMVNAGTHEVLVLRDNWTVVTKDSRLSAHYENTVAVTDGEADILTLF